MLFFLKLLCCSEFSRFPIGTWLWFDVWFAIELRRSVPVQQSNIKSTRLAYLNDVSDNVVRTKGDVWNAVPDFRRGTGGENKAFGRATVQLLL